MNKDIADYYEEIVKDTNDYKSASNWVMVEVLKILNQEKININDFAIYPKRIAQLINIVNEGIISGKIAKEIFPIMLKEDKNPLEIVKEKGLAQISDSGQIEKLIDKLFANFNKQVEEYLNGKDKVLGFFIGQIMKETQGKANPKIVNKILKDKLARIKNAQN